MVPHKLRVEDAPSRIRRVLRAHDVLRDLHDALGAQPHRFEAVAEIAERGGDLGGEVWRRAAVGFLADLPGEGY